MSKEYASLLDLSLGQYMFFMFFTALGLFSVVVFIAGGTTITENSAAEILCESHGAELIKYDFRLEKVVCISTDVNSLGRTGISVFERGLK